MVRWGLVQANQGWRQGLAVRGVPLGREAMLRGFHQKPKSCIIVVVATDVPLGPRYLVRLARRAGIGVAHTAAMGDPLSGDLFLAFVTHPPVVF